MTVQGQIGLIRSCKLTFLKSLRKILAPRSELHYSQTGEDIILQFLIDKYLGGKVVCYVDVGCNDPKRISNTYLQYLRGGSGLVIDMNESFEAAFIRERPKDIFVCAAVSDAEEDACVYEFNKSEVNTINSEQAIVWNKYWKQKSQHSVQTVMLGDIISRYMPDSDIDVLLLDVEGHELPVLKGVDLAKLRPKIIVSEVHDLDFQNAEENSIVNYLIQQGYRLEAYATMNAYFMLSALCSKN